MEDSLRSLQKLSGLRACKLTLFHRRPSLFNLKPLLLLEEIWRGHRRTVKLIRFQSIRLVLIVETKIRKDLKGDKELEPRQERRMTIQN